ncbi:MAG: succinate dehydrogenase [Desulfobulbaceae bacterium]|nr:succinate dehydrogenase [Desulfobulbaceae bacterium]
MGWLRTTLNSSIGNKAVMALTGLLLGLFIAAHLAGLANIFRGRAALTTHATQIHNLGGLLHLAELFLLLIFLLHLGFGLRLFIANRLAKPRRYAVAGRRSQGCGVAPTMPYTGLMLLLFLACHLAHFRFCAPAPAGELVATTLAQPVTGVFYLMALLTLGLHLRHGLWSLCQSLGLSHPKYDPLLAGGAAVAGSIITALFMTIPLLALWWPDFLR